MGLFQNKKIQSLVALIIVLMTILWIFQNNVFGISNFKSSSSELKTLESKSEDLPYIEKIENFSINEYSDDEKILYEIIADTYFSYKNSPIELINVLVKTYDDSQKEGAILSSKLAQILESSEIIFNGNVNIKTVNSVHHEIESEILIYDLDKGEIISNTNVIYSGENAKIKAIGMHMKINDDKLLLKDAVNISDESGSIIDTSQLLINHSNGEKIYTSDNKTLYRSDENEITANAGLKMEISKNLTNLLGKVTILQKSGTKINTSNLEIDKSDDLEIYKTDYLTEYVSSETYIKANKMYYDVISKKINLIGAVTAVYE